MESSQRLKRILDLMVCVVVSLWPIHSLFTFGWILCHPTNTFTNMVKASPVQGIDFVKHMSLGALARSDPKHVYDLDAQRIWVNGAIDPQFYVDVRHCNPSYYTPPLCVLLEPLSLLPLEKGYVLWCLGQVAAAILVVTKVSGFRTKAFDRYYFWAVILASPPALQSIYLGQTAFILSALLAGFYLAWRDDKQILSGALIACFALFKPHHCLVPGIMLLAKRQWKGIASLIGTSVLLYAIAAAALGPDVVLGYPQFLAFVERGTYNGDYYAPKDICVNLRCIAGYVLATHQAEVLGLALTAFVAGVSYFVWRQSLKCNGLNDGHAMFISVGLSLALGLHANFYDVVLLCVPYAMTLTGVGINFAYKQTSVRDRVWTLSFLAFWLGSLIFVIYSPVPKYTTNWHCLIIIAFVALSAYMFRRNIAVASAIANGGTPKL